MQRSRADESSALGYDSQFEHAVRHVRTEFVKKGIQISDTQKLTLYALFKQVTHGDCAVPRPGKLWARRGLQFVLMYLYFRGILTCGNIFFIMNTYFLGDSC